MGGQQVPADSLIAKFSSRLSLTLTTLIAAAGYLVVAHARGPAASRRCPQWNLSILYGTAPSLAPHGDIGRGFAVFYTGVIGAGGLAPFAYGAIADRSSQTVGILAAAATAAAVVPFVLALQSALKRERCVPVEQEQLAGNQAESSNGFDRNLSTPADSLEKATDLRGCTIRVFPMRKVADIGKLSNIQV